MRLDYPFPPTASLEEHMALVAQRREAIRQQRRAWGVKLAALGRAAKLAKIQAAEEERAVGLGSVMRPRVDPKYQMTASPWDVQIESDSSMYNAVDYAECYGVGETVAMFREWLLAQMEH